MAYHVELSEQAQVDIEGAYERIRADAPAAALRWRRGIQQKIKSLDTFPLGCGLAYEDRYVSDDLRQTFYGSYRILYVVRGEIVYVVHVRHGSRRNLSREETAGIVGS
jgi:plasmid stabilization system protein ParE